MNKTGVIVLGLLFITSSSIFAQKDSTAKKNEFGLGLSNFLIHAIGGVQEEPTPLVLTYKRVIHTNWALLANYSYGTSLKATNQMPSRINDSTYIASYESAQKRTQMIRVGAEYRHALRPKLLFVAGLQLQAAVANNKHDYYTWTGDSLRSDNNLILFPEHETIKTNRKTLDSKQMGLCMHAGLMTPLSKRLMLSAIWRPSMMISTNKEVKINEQTGVINEYTYTQSEFTSAPLITEVSLFYRF